MELRTEQQDVVSYSSGLMGVSSVPGAGKTTSLAALATRLIAEEMGPGQKLLVVTVQNAAVSNFKAKMRTFLSLRGLPARGYEVKTLHSLALLIIKTKPEFFMIDREFEILDETRRDRVLSQVVDAWVAANQDRLEEYLKYQGKRPENALTQWNARARSMLGSMIGHIKRQGVSKTELWSIGQRCKEHFSNSFLAWSLEVMEAYTAEMQQMGCVDFDDLIMLAYQLLKDDEGVRKRFQDRWAFVLEDEAQDSNPIQNEILKLLTAGHNNLVRVGDLNQSIMGFSGSSPDSFNRFCDEVMTRPILTASRSTREIMDFANNFVRWVRESYPEPACRDALTEQFICGVEEDDPCPNPVANTYGISLELCEQGPEEEALAAADTAARLAKENPDKTIALLFRSLASQSAAIIYQLKTAGVECEEINAQLDVHSLGDIKHILKFLAHPYDKDLLMDTIPIIQPGFEDYDPGPITDLLQELLPEDILYPLGGEWDRLPPELAGTPELEDLQAALARLRGWLEVSALRPDELILHLAGDLGMSGDDLELASNLSIQVSRLLRENPEYGLNEIIEEMKQLERSTNFMASILRDSRGYTPRPGVVTIATQHRSKGLEWDIVIVAGLGLDEFPEKLNDKSKSEFGHLKAEYLNPLAAAKAQLEYMRNGTRASKDAVIRQAKEDEIREGLRLLYVAFTRAREQLVIYGHRMNSYKKYLAKSEIWRELTRYVGEASQNANT